MIALRPFILRSNRFLGSTLIDQRLITNEDLERANERLLVCIQEGNFRAANLLNILLFDLQCLDEGKMIDRITEHESVGVMDLANYRVDLLDSLKVDLEFAWATFTLPFDRVENFTMIATSYYWSKPAVNFWAEQFEGDQVLWYVASVNSVASALQRHEESSKAAVSEGGGKA